MNTYGGFKIGYLKNGNLIYSQIMAVLFTNLVTYLQVAVIDRRLVNPAYLLPVTGLELIFIVVWTMIFQMVYRNMFPPRRMLFIEGDRKDYHLMDKINARKINIRSARLFPIKRIWKQSKRKWNCMMQW